MRGSITKLVKKRGCGFVLGEDGCEVYFDQASLDGVDLRALSIGEWVEYELHFGAERLRAARLRPLLGSRAPTVRGSSS